MLLTILIYNLIMALAVAGALFSLSRYVAVGVYLLAIFFGQLIFSSYIMHISNHFFD